jgi:hypothetical protein
MTRRPLLLLSIWLDAAKMLRSTPLTLAWLVTALAEIIPEVRGALGVGVDVLTDPTMLVQLTGGNDGLPADVGVLHYHGIRGSKLALDAVVSFVAPTSASFPLQPWNLVLSAATPRLS